MTTAKLGNFVGTDIPPIDTIRSCVHCGFCLPSCPTYQLTGRERSSPRGRIWLMKSVAEGKLDVLDPIFEDEMSFCLNCRACEAVCPSGVQYGEILEASRAQIEKRRDEGVGESTLKALTFDYLFKDMDRFRLASYGAQAYQRTGLRSAVQKSGVLELLGLVETEQMMPEMKDDFIRADGQTWSARGKQRGRVGLFVGCIMGTAYAHVHNAMIRVLTRNGYEVTAISEQGCCGALHVHGGDPDGGRTLARRNIDAFECAGMDAIIVNAAGCGAALKEYGHLLSSDDAYHERATAFSDSVQDINEFLAEEGLREEPGALSVRVTYQEPCHLAHAQRITRQPRILLNSIPELELREMPESSLCCGSAGIYNLLQPEAAQELGDRKLMNALSTDPEIIVSANPGCMLQLQAGLRARGDQREVLHVIEVLDRAYQSRDARSASQPAAV